MKARRHPAGELLRFFAAMLFIVAIPMLMVGAIVAPIGEPYRDWFVYFRTWLQGAVILTLLFSPFFLAFFVAVSLVPKDQSHMLLHSVPGVLRAWWVMPCVVAWCVLRLIAAPTVNPNVGVGFNSNSADLGLLSDIAVVTSNCATGVVLIAIVVVAMAFGIRREWRTYKWQARNLCANCGYMLRGLRHSSPCPECGARQTFDEFV